MLLGVQLPIAAAVAFNIYCIVLGVRHGFVPCQRPKAMAHFVIMISGLRSTADPILCAIVVS